MFFCYGLVYLCDYCVVGFWVLQEVVVFVYDFGLVVVGYVYEGVVDEDDGIVWFVGIGYDYWYVCYFDGCEEDIVGVIVYCDFGVVVVYFCIIEVVGRLMYCGVFGGVGYCIFFQWVGFGCSEVMGSELFLGVWIRMILMVFGLIVIRM